MINKLHSSHTGIMPIRVLQHNLIHAFENMNPEFLKLSKEIVDTLGLDPGIRYSANEEEVRSPGVVYGKMAIDESFLSYVWCVTFSLTALYAELIVKKSHNDYVGKEEKVLNMLLLRKAFAVWEYAVVLLREYRVWPKDLPNPENYEDEYDELIGKVNGLYLVAMEFVLAHEFAHIELRHNSRVDPLLNLDEQNTLFEKEADERAISLVLAGRDGTNETTIRMGLLIGLCSLLFFSGVTKGNAYPDTDERIEAILRIINPDPQDAMWGIATLAYKLWDRLYDKKLLWTDGLETPKALYYSIKRQVEKLNGGG
jgi:hypothetical protein